MEKVEQAVRILQSLKITVQFTIVVETAGNMLNGTPIHIVERDKYTDIPFLKWISAHMLKIGGPLDSLLSEGKKNSISAGIKTQCMVP